MSRHQRDPLTVHETVTTENSGALSARVLTDDEVRQLLARPGGDQLVGWARRVRLEAEALDQLLHGEDEPSKVLAFGRDRKDVGTAMWKMTKPNGNGLIILISQSGYYWPASRPWPEPPEDEKSSNRSNRSNRQNAGNRSNRDDQGELFNGHEQPEAVSGTSSNIQATGQPDTDQEGERRPVAPVAPVPSVWRCGCGSYEWRQTPYDTVVCDGCNKPAEGVR